MGNSMKKRKWQKKASLVLGAVRQENTRFSEVYFCPRIVKMLGNTNKYFLCFSLHGNKNLLSENCVAPENMKFSKTRQKGRGILCVCPALLGAVFG